MNGPTKYGTIAHGAAAVTQYHLGSGVDGRVSSLFIQIDLSSSPAADHSITIKGRAKRDGSGIDMPLTAIAYKNFATGANATAAITADALILVDASNMDIFADVTTVTTGTARYSCTPLLG